MALSKGKGGLLGLLAHEPANIFEPVSTALDGFGAGRIQSHCGVFLDQLTQTHNGAQRLWTTCVAGGSSPFTAGLTHYRSPIDPITACGLNPGVPTSCSQASAKLVTVVAGI